MHSLMMSSPLWIFFNSLPASYSLFVTQNIHSKYYFVFIGLAHSPSSASYSDLILHQRQQECTQARYKDVADIGKDEHIGLCLQ